MKYTHKRMPQPTKRRNSKGAVLGLVLASTFIFTILVTAIFNFSLLMRGSQQVKSAVEAGALNVAREVIGLTVAAGGGNEQQFLDVADDQGKFGISNINRVIGKAMMVQMNLAQMVADGTVSGQAVSNANRMYDGARGINRSVSSNVSRPDNLYPLFEAASKNNSFGLIGGGSVEAGRGNQWQTALVDRGGQSNVFLTPEQLESYVSGTSFSMLAGKDGNQYLPGYKPVQILDKTFCFVPMKRDKQIALITKDEFEANRPTVKPIEGWNDVVANAFACFGQNATSAATNQDSMAYAQADPPATFDITIPNGFVKIVLPGNTAQFHVNSIPVERTTYGYRPEVKKSGSYPVGAGSISAVANLGNEYVPPTLKKVIYAFSQINYSETTRVLIQRIRQFKPKFTEADLEVLLSATTVNPGDREFIIFRLGDGPVVLLTAPQAMAAGGSFHFASPADGSEKTIVREFGNNDFTNVTVIPEGGAVPLPSWTITEGEHRWKPATGFDGCLGELTIERTTRVFANAGSSGV